MYWPIQIPLRVGGMMSYKYQCGRTFGNWTQSGLLVLKCTMFVLEFDMDIYEVSTRIYDIYDCKAKILSILKVNVQTYSYSLSHFCKILVNMASMKCTISYIKSPINLIIYIRVSLRPSLSSTAVEDSGIGCKTSHFGPFFWGKGIAYSLWFWWILGVFPTFKFQNVHH